MKTPYGGKTLNKEGAKSIRYRNNSVAIKVNKLKINVQKSYKNLCLSK
jgi:hypothetical protein